MTKETLDILENELNKTRNCTFKSETIKQLIALARAGLEADDLKEQVAFLQTDLGAMERVSNNLKQELSTLKQSLAPVREVLDKCDCHTKTPSYPVFRSQLHVEGCHYYEAQQLAGKALEYQQVAALVCLKLDLLKMMAESPSLKAQVLLAHQEKEEIIKDPSKRAKEYKAHFSIFSLAIDRLAEKKEAG